MSQRGISASAKIARLRQRLRTAEADGADIRLVDIIKALLDLLGDEL